MLPSGGQGPEPLFSTYQIPGRIDKPALMDHNTRPSHMPITEYSSVPSGPVLHLQAIKQSKRLIIGHQHCAKTFCMTSNE